MATIRNLSLPEYRTLADFRYALRQFLGFSEAAAQRSGLTPQQYQALLAIKGYPGKESVTIGQLARRLQLRHHSTVELIDRMTRAKLLKRERSAMDRRQVFVELTPRGEKVLARLAAVHREQLRKIGPRLRDLLSALAETPTRKSKQG